MKLLNAEVMVTLVHFYLGWFLSQSHPSCLVEGGWASQEASSHRVIQRAQAAYYPPDLSEEIEEPSLALHSVHLLKALSLALWLEFPSPHDNYL